MHYKSEEALFLVVIIARELNIDENSLKEAVRMLKYERREVIEVLVENTNIIEGMMESVEINNYGKVISYIVYMCYMYKHDKIVVEQAISESRKLVSEIRHNRVSLEE